MIKKFENFFGGSKSGSQQANFNSSTVSGTNLTPDEFTSGVDLSSRLNDIKEEICLDILNSNLGLEDLRKINNFLKSLS